MKAKTIKKATPAANKMGKDPFKKAKDAPMGKKTMIGGKNMTMKKRKMPEDAEV